jgi:hypothetical protein
MLHHGSRRCDVFIWLKESMAAGSAVASAAHADHNQGTKGQKVISHRYPFLEMLS